MQTKETSHLDGCLGIISGTTVALENGQIWINHSIGRLIEALMARSDDAYVCLPVLSAKTAALNHVLKLDPSRLLKLPPLQTTISAQKYYLQVRGTLKRVAQKSDVLFIRLPFQLPDRVLKLDVPKVLHVVSSPAQVVQASSDYSGLMRMAAVGFAKHSERCIKRAGRERLSRVCTNGIEMWKRLDPPAGRVVVSSCMYRSEMSEKEDFSLGDPARLLFVGYLRPEKGVLDLLDAFDKLREKKNATLTLAGGSDRNTSAGRLIEERITRSVHAKDIKTVGMVNFGKDLFSLYRNHDVLVQPSLSEGTPRTLVEARALGLPVVATNVGGIPSSVTHEEDGLLVPKTDPNALAEAIHRLLTDENLRLRLIRRGLQNQEAYSLEDFADQLIDETRVALREARVANC
jgi:glycosyltransferase involved in cell wall biosynthesis